MYLFHSIRLLTAVAIALAVLVIAPSASASRLEGEGYASHIQMRQEKRASIVQIQGPLSCDMGSVNTGKACVLRVLDTRSGKVYTLTNNGDAMKLFNSGTRTVSIEGRFSDSQTLEVAKVSAL